MTRTVRFTLNGKPVGPSVDDARMLLWVIRTELGLTGTKFGCGEGYCGACTVLVDGEPVRSCQTPVKTVEGKKVLTIEGLEKDGRLHPLQEAFARNDALQCGYCTPGMILTALAFLRSNPKPTAEEVSESLEGNLCRCGTHHRIIPAVLEAAAALQGGGRHEKE
jgi:aerobic-type carbon monoxide dehydrogenase small subunit (CoxS/CutS family)